MGWGQHAKIGDAGIAAVEGPLDTMVEKGEVLQFIEVGDSIWAKALDL